MGFLLRWLAAFVLLAATYNPTEWSYVRWAMANWQEEMEKLHGRAEVIIGKQRHGPIGTVDLSFEGRFTRFGNLEKFRGDGF